MIYSIPVMLNFEAKNEQTAKARAEEICDSLQSISNDVTAVFYEIDKLMEVGRCELCRTENVQLVAKLKADPDQRVCKVCASDKRILVIPRKTK